MGHSMVNPSFQDYKGLETASIRAQNLEVDYWGQGPAGVKHKETETFLHHPAFLQPSPVDLSVPMAKNLTPFSLGKPQVHTQVNPAAHTALQAGQSKYGYDFM